MLIELLTALAWEPTGADWTWQESATDHAWTVTSGDPALQAALADALASWNAVGPEVFHWPPLDPTGRGQLLQESTGPGATLAIAQTWSDDRRLLRCSITLYEHNERGPTGLSPLLPAPPGTTQLRFVLAHELGHCLGLDHSTDPGALMRPVVTPRASARWGPTPDDVAGFAALYAPPTATFTVTGWTLDDLGDGDGLLEPGEQALLRVHTEGDAVGRALSVEALPGLAVEPRPLEPTSVLLTVGPSCSSGTPELSWTMQAANAPPVAGAVSVTLTCGEDTAEETALPPAGCSATPRVIPGWPFRRR